jgi:hypothetical protein
VSNQRQRDDRLFLFNSEFLFEAGEPDPDPPPDPDPVSAVILLETGGRRLLETGGRLVREEA